MSSTLFLAISYNRRELHIEKCVWLQSYHVKTWYLHCQMTDWALMLRYRKRRSKSLDLIRSHNFLTAVYEDMPIIGYSGVKQQSHLT